MVHHCKTETARIGEKEDLEIFLVAGVITDTVVASVVRVSSTSLRNHEGCAMNEEFLFWAGLLSLFLGGIMTSVYIKRKRKAEFRELAQKRGFIFTQNMSDLIEQLSEFKIFSLGHSRHIDYGIEGQVGAQKVYIMSYVYIVGHGNNRSRRRQMVCVCKKKEQSIPHFFLRREIAIYDHIGKVFGKQDINFDDDPEFSKSFVLQGELEDSTRKFFHAGKRQLFMEFAGTDLCMEACEDTAVAHYGKMLSLEDADKLMDDTLRIQSMLR
jgi:hypothetical protein